MAPLLTTELSSSGVLTLTLDSPANRNALSTTLLTELSRALHEAQTSSGVRAVLITGEGPVFCAGADLKAPRGPVEGAASATLPDVLMAIRDHRCPVIARVNGPARAGGIGLFAACDIAIGLEAATFAFTEVRLGVVPAIISVPVVERVGRRAAREYFLTGDVFDGRTARRLGLLDQAVPEHELDGAVAARLASLLRGEPGALAAVKQLTRRLSSSEERAELERLQGESAQWFATAPAREGMRAFAERRPPSWVSEL